MKQHYKTSVYAFVFLLIATTYVKIHNRRPGKPIPDLPTTLLSQHAKKQSISTHDSTITSIQQSLAKREYNISFDEEKKTLQSPNRKQGLRAYYKPGELTINNRVDSAGYNFSFKLINKGIFADRKKIFSPQKQATVENLDNKLQIKHNGFTEEFINNEEGVRQNFIINAAPKSTKELQVRLSPAGLKVNDLQNNELQFFAENKKGEVINNIIYKDIKCWDAGGKTLPATLRYEDELVMLTVDVQHAAYPVTIDPIVVNGNPTNATAMVESNQLNAWMGGSVASAGDVNGDGYSDILVSASKYDNGQVDEGAVFVYNGSASGINAAAPTILESDQKEARFGAYVSSAGDINKDGFSDIIIGAHMYDKGQSNEGAAFVYYGSAQGINKVASLILESNQAEANMGNAVGLAGDVNGDGFSDVLVAARAYTNGQSKEGVVFLYSGSAAGLNTTPVLIEQNQPDAMFGFSASGAGDVNGDGYSDIMIGARLFDKGEADEGAVFIYHGSALGINPGAAATVLESNQKDAYLGHTVNPAGDVNGDGYSDIIVGANMYDKGQTNEGAAFVHYGSAQGVNVAVAVVLEKNQIEAQFGYSVASAGDVNGDGYADVIVGAMYYDNGQSNEGSAFIYQGSSTGLSLTPVSTLESNQAGAQLGSNVSSAGDVNGDGYSDVVVGAVLYANGQGGEGAAFIWLGNAEEVSNVAALMLEGNQNDALYGHSAGSAGDINGDGFDDIIVGAYNYDNGQSNEGAVFVYHGSKNGININFASMLELNQVNANFGYSASSAGDVNGDGYSDIVVGAPKYSNGQLNEGCAIIFYGSSNGVNSLGQIVVEGNQQSASTGNSVSSAGDVNADGYGDIIIGSYNFNNGEKEEGRATVFYGSDSGIDSITKTILENNQPTAFMGWSVSGCGDINADGYDDIAIGSILYATDGATFIYHGSGTGINDNPAIILKVSGQSGTSVSSAGDVNGDGFSDIVIGAPYYYENGATGKAIIFYGSLMGLTEQNKSVLKGIQNFSVTGWSVSGIGDVNGDGYTDVAIGAPQFDNGQTNEGRVFIYYGSSSGILNEPISFAEANQTAAQMGASVAGAGDVNGDGYSDILVAAPQFDNGQSNEGAVFMFYGNNSDGIQNNLRLYNSNLTTPINQSQKSKNHFGAGLYAKSFLGKNKGKLVWETKAKGQGFSKGTNNVITNSTLSSGSQNAYAGLGLTGAELKNVIAKQGSSTKVRVRVKYDPALALTGQVYGPWRYLPSYLTGNSSAPAPEEVVNDMTQTVKRKVDESMGGKEGELLYVYPNPASERLMLKFGSADQMKSIQLLTVGGKSVYRSLVQVSEIDVRRMAAGNYILLVTHGDGSMSTRKVVIEK